MSDRVTGDAPVSGERGSTIVHRVRSVQSRLANLLPLAVVVILGLGLLTWYYMSTLRRPIQDKLDAQASALRRAQGDAVLPPLGRVEAPTRAREELQTDPPIAAPVTLQEIPLESEVRADATPLRSSAAPNAGPSAKTPAELERERQLGGAAYVAQAAQVPVALATNAAPPIGEPDSNSLNGLLRPSMTTLVRAERLPTTRLLLPKGAFIDCTLETAIDSTLPGMTTCVMATDSFGADGQVVLLERGTKLVGEVRGQVQQGAARLFVLWSEARTPTGVIVPLASPGTDELGRAGLSGTVDRHFWQRFGAAMLVSVIDGAVQAGVQASSRGSGALVYDPSGAQGVMTEILKSTVNIPPTITKRQGDRIQVLVARDLDFRSVYELRARGIAHE
jgi:type IV secretion system protein VirB10